MRIGGHVEQADVDEVRKLMLGKLYRVRFVLNPFAYGVLGGWAVIMLWFWWRHHVLVPGAVIASILPVVLLLGLHFRGAYTSRDQQLTRLNATLPDSIVVLPNCVQLEADDGKMLFTPLVRYKSYLEGKRVIWLKAKDGETDVVLPVSNISASDRHSLKECLETVLPPTMR